MSGNSRLLLERFPSRGTWGSSAHFQLATLPASRPAPSQRPHRAARQLKVGATSTWRSSANFQLATLPASRPAPAPGSPPTESWRYKYGEVAPTFSWRRCPLAGQRPHRAARQLKVGATSTPTWEPLQVDYLSWQLPQERLVLNPGTSLFCCKPMRYSLSYSRHPTLTPVKGPSTNGDHCPGRYQGRACPTPLAAGASPTRVRPLRTAILAKP